MNFTFSYRNLLCQVFNIFLKPKVGEVDQVDSKEGGQLLKMLISEALSGKTHIDTEPGKN